MFGQMMSPDLSNQMYAELVRIGEQERRVARERKAARVAARRLARRRLGRGRSSGRVPISPAQPFNSKTELRERIAP